MLQLLWGQTSLALIQNPLPRQFKEALFIHLSRYAGSPWAVVWHGYTLIQPGLAPDRFGELIDSSPPGPPEISQPFLLLLEEAGPFQSDWPEPGSRLEKALFRGAVSVFLGRNEAPSYRKELRRLLGPEAFDRLLLFIGFVKNFHLWVENHPALSDPPAISTHPFAETMQAYRERFLRIGEDRAPASSLSEDRFIEEALRFSENRLQMLIEQSPLSIQIFAPDGSAIAANSAWEALWGARREELKGYNILQDPQLARKGMMLYVQRAFSGEARRIPPMRYDPAEIGKPGRPRWVEAHIYPVKDASDTLKEVVLLLEDVTRRKEAEEGIRRSEERHRALLEAIPDTLFMLSREGVFLDYKASKAFDPAFPPDTFLGRRIDDLLPEAVGRKALEAAEAAIRTGEIQRFEYALSLDAGKRDYEARMTAGGPDQVFCIVRDITERKAAEEGLRLLSRQVQEQADTLRGILSASVDHIYVFDREGRYRYVSAAGAAVLGLKPSDLAGKSGRDIGLPPDLMEKVDRQREEAMSTGRSVISEADFTAPDGIHSYEYILTPTFNVEGAVNGVVAISRDVTRRKAAEEEKEKVMSQLQAIVRQMPAGLILAEAPSGKLLLGNDQGDQIWRHPFQPSSEIGEYREYKGFHPDGRPYQAEEWPLARAIQKGETVIDEEIEILRGDGTRGTMRASASPIRNREGKTIAGVVIFSDITEQKQATEALKGAYSHLRTQATELQRQLHISEVLHRMSGQFIIGEAIDPFLNEVIREVAMVMDSAMGWIALVDHESDALIPQAFYGIDPERARGLRVPIPRDETDPVYRILYQGETLILDAVFSDPRVEPYRPFIEMFRIQSVLAVPLQVRGEPIGVLNVYNKAHGQTFTPVDVRLLQTVGNQIAIALSNTSYYRRLQKTNDALQKKTEEAETANRFKSQLLSNVSHELRTPLNAIIGYNHLLLDEAYGRVDEEKLAPLQGIQRNSEELLKLVNDVLDLSKIEAGKLSLSVGEVRLASLIDGILEGMRLLIENKSLSVQLKIEEALPVLRSDAEKVRQIVVNLLSNAIKFTRKGGITITAENRPEKQGVEIAIRDTGIGIQPEALSRIFEAFYQVDGNLTREFEGTGLGLSIVRELVRLLNGEIDVQSEYGSGSTFRVFLPYRLQAEGLPPAHP